MSTMPRPAQPDTALLIRRFSPELIEIIIGYSCPPPALGRNTPTMAVGLVCHDLWCAAARYIWRIVTIRSDNKMQSLRSIIEAAGGSDGRVGSAIRAIYAVNASETCMPEYVVLAASCKELRRFEAPLVDFAPMVTQNFHRIQTLSIYGDRDKRGFEAMDLVGLTGLKYLTVSTTVRIPQGGPGGPKPLFSLAGLVWEGAKDPDAIRWVLHNSPELQILGLYAASLHLFQECLTNHGGSLLSLRLNLQGALPNAQHPTLFDHIRTWCPKILELLLDIGPDPELIGQLPSSLERLALRPSADSSLLKGNTLVDYAEANKDLLITLWGEHVRNVIDTAAQPKRLIKGKRERAVVKKYAKWKGNDRLHFMEQIDWPFGDLHGGDYISPSIQDDRYR